MFGAQYDQDCPRKSCAARSAQNPLYLRRGPAVLDAFEGRVAQSKMGETPKCVQHEVGEQYLRNAPIALAWCLFLQWP
jgi:hypothetical protein